MGHPQAAKTPRPTISWQAAISSWWVIGASIFASNIGSEHIVGLAGSGAVDGVAMAHYELHAWCLLVLAWVFVPFYARSLVFTMPEFLERRFSPASRYMLSVVSLITFVVSKIAVGIFAGGVVFSTLLPDVNLNLAGVPIDSFWIGSVLVILLTGLYTTLGGMRAVAYNDAVQTIVLIIGSATLTGYGLYQLGGWHELRTVCGSDMFNLWKPLIPAGVEGTWAPVKESGRMAWYFNTQYPWLGMAICAPIIGLWYWCTDQYIVQRALGAPNEQVARRGSIFAAFLKLFPVYLFIIPGLIWFALAKSHKLPGLEELGLATADGRLAARRGPRGVSADGQIPAAGGLARHRGGRLALRPDGLAGRRLQRLLDALYGRSLCKVEAAGHAAPVGAYRPACHRRHGVIALAWIPVIKGAHGLYDYLQAVQGYLAPPIFVVFFFGVVFKRLNAKGCFAAMVVGFLLGIFRMLVDTPVTMKLAGFEHGYTPGTFLWIVNNIYFQYFSVLIVWSARRDGRRELCHRAAVAGTDPGTHVRDRHQRTAAAIAEQLVLARIVASARIGSYRGGYLYFTG